MPRRDPEDETQQFPDDEELKERLTKEKERLVQGTDVEVLLIPLPSFDLVVKKYWGKCYALAFSIVGQHERAEDATMDGFVHAYSALLSPSYPSQRIRELHLRAWLFRIVQNDAKKHRDEKRKHWQEPSIESSEPGIRYEILWKRVIDVEEQAQFNEKYEAFLKAFTDLSKKEQIALYMKFGLELTYKEISSILGEPEGTIKPRVLRARNKLRKQLGKDYPELLDKEDDEKGERP